MNRAEYLLTIAGEESCEVGQRIAKALRFGLTEIEPGQPLTNAQRIIGEFHDLFVMLDWLRQEGLLPTDAKLVPSIATDAAKRAKVEKFMAISRAEGTLE